MREQLKLLETLQQVDADLHEKELALSSLPTKLQSLKDDVSRVEMLLQKELVQLEDSQRLRAELEGGIKGNQDQLNKSKGKLTQVRTSKEYMATQREMEATRKSNQEREDELLKLMEAIESSQKSINEHQEDLKALQEHVKVEETETQETIAGLQVEVNALQAKRDKMGKGIRRDVLAKYDVIRHRRGNAVVPARKGVCTGCHMQLPPQLFNILQRENSIEYCPSCRRIVYFEGEEQ